MSSFSLSKVLALFGHAELPDVVPNNTSSWMSYLIATVLLKAAGVAEFDLS